jgi:hypothetical protein
MMKAKNVVTWVIALGVLLFIFEPAHASTIFGLDFRVSGTANPRGTAPWTTAKFENMTNTVATLSTGTEVGKASNPGVKLTMSTSDLTGGENVRKWYFNFDNPDVAVDDLKFVYDGGSTGPKAVNIRTDKDDIEAQGGGLFDIRFAFSANGDRFGRDEEVVYLITAQDGSHIDPSDFSSGSQHGSDDGYFSAAKIRAVRNSEGRVAFIADSAASDNGDGIVPIPGAVWLLGSGFVGLALIRNRFKN